MEAFLKGVKLMIVKISSKEFDVKRMTLISDDRFLPICSFLISKEGEKVTLRDMKRHFPDFSNLDVYIDELVTEKLVLRHHGKYQYVGEFISTVEQTKINEYCLAYFNDKKVSIEAYLENQSKDQLAFRILYQLFNKNEEESIVIYESNEYSKKWLAQPTRYTEIMAKNTLYFSFGSYNPFYSHHICDYFNFLTLNEKNGPEDFLKLREKLGDLNPTYFLTYCERKLRRLEKGKIIPTEKTDIFMEALLEMGYVSIEDSSYKLNMIRLHEAEELDQLNSFLPDSFSKAQEVFIMKVSFYNWLLEQKIIDAPKTLHGMM